MKETRETIWDERKLQEWKLQIEAYEGNKASFSSVEQLASLTSLWEMVHNFQKFLGTEENGFLF